MDPLIAAAVLGSAIMHASWNALVKGAEDSLLSQAFVIGSGGVLALPVVLWMGPIESASVPYIAGGVALHAGYHWFLARGYQHGDLAVVYPIARGVAPLLVAVIALAAGEAIAPSTLVGIVAIGGGILSLGWGERAQGRAVVYALATGAFIAGYSYVDGTGTRLASEPLAYVAWLYLLTAVPIVVYVLRYRRRDFLVFARDNFWTQSLGGFVASLGYLIVLWAYRQASVPPVSALRETSVLFATLIAAVMLREPVGPRRVFAAVAVVLGVVLVTLSN